MSDERVMVHFYCIYENPSDFPGKFVIREWDVVRPDRDSKTGDIRVARQPFAVVNTLEQARSTLPEKLYRLRRSIDDDPCIVEVWL